MQLSYSDAPAAGLPGMYAEGGTRETISRLLSTQRLVQVTVDAAADGTYVIEIDGEEVASFERDSAENVETIRDELLSDLQDSEAAITAEAVSTDGILIQGTNQDSDFEIAVSAPADNLLVATLVEFGQEVAFGRGVVVDERADSATQARLPRVSADVTARFLGVALRDSSREHNEGGWPDKSSVSIARRGRLYVTVEDAVEEGGDVFCRFAAGSGGTQLGAFRSDADSASAAQVPRAHFAKAAGAGELAIIQLT